MSIGRNDNENETEGQQTHNTKGTQGYKTNQKRERYLSLGLFELNLRKTMKAIEHWQTKGKDPNTITGEDIHTIPDQDSIIMRKNGDSSRQRKQIRQKLEETEYKKQQKRKNSETSRGTTKHNMKETG